MRKMVPVLIVLALLGLFASSVSHGQESSPLFVPAPGSPIPVAGSPGNVVLGDVNGDGKLDLVAGMGRSITVLLGKGNGRFQPAQASPIPLPDPPSEMVLADIDGNSTLDLAIATHDSYGVMLLLGDGKGNFALAATSPVVIKQGKHPHTHGLGIGDLNGDGYPDLVTANNEDNDIAVAFGDGRGAFSPASGSPFAVGRSPYPLAVGDVNNDQHLDIVSTSATLTSRALTVLFGDGRGNFRRSDIPLRTAGPGYVAIGEVNGDHKPDLVVTHLERSELTVLIGDGSGSFTEVTESPFNLGHSAWHAAIVDINRDGKADVVAAANNGVRAMLGDGRGDFQPAPGSPFPAGKGAWQLAVGDINGDGKPDIATSNLESDSVTILLAQ